VAYDIAVLITSIPLNAMPAIKDVVENLAANTIAIHMSSYSPARGGRVQALEEGRMESADAP
jgi:3-hydroxyisobutyrate dehydrogenase-like beta-hydroxyacid dehydrogenase